MCQKLFKFNCGHHKYYKVGGCVCQATVNGVESKAGSCPGRAGGTPSSSSSSSSASTR